MAILNWLNRRLPDSIYAGAFQPFFSALERATLWECFRMRARQHLHVLEDGKLPPWVSELYQLVWVGLEVVLVLTAAAAVRAGWFVAWIGVLTLYRSYEIFLFALGWVFWDPYPLHTYKRSLASFLLNLGEIVLFYAAAYIALGCVNCEKSLATSIYSSLRTSVTIGPIATAEPPQSVSCGVFLIAQIALSLFLTIIVVASIVGALRKRAEVTETTAA